LKARRIKMARKKSKGKHCLLEILVMTQMKSSSRSSGRNLAIPGMLYFVRTRISRLKRMGNYKQLTKEQALYCSRVKK
jgi:hypothetical protein